MYQGLDEAPSHVKAAPRLFNDMSALQVLLQGPLPCQRLVRAIGVGSVWYGGVDASGQGFGGMVEKEGVIEFEFGQ